jgi:flagellar biosynthetic protein FliQ
MNEGDIGAVLRETVTVVLKLGGPPLIAALVVGLVMSLVQVITQINEQTVAFVPKAAAVVGSLVVLGPFMLATLSDFVRLLFDQLVAVGGS